MTAPLCDNSRREKFQLGVFGNQLHRRLDEATELAANGGKTI